MQLTVETFIKTITQTPFKPFTGIQRARFDFHDNHNKLEKINFNSRDFTNDFSQIIKSSLVLTTLSTSFCKIEPI